MVLQYWIWITVGISFLIYIAIALISRASSTGEFYIAGKGVHPLQMEWLQLQIGCQQPHLFLWQV